MVSSESVSSSLPSLPLSMVGGRLGGCGGVGDGWVGDGGLSGGQVDSRGLGGSGVGSGVGVEKQMRSPLMIIESFLTALTSADKDGRIVITKAGVHYTLCNPHTKCCSLFL